MTDRLLHDSSEDRPWRVFKTPHIWHVRGHDLNVFGAHKYRNVEVLACTELEAINQAHKHFPGLTVVEAWPTGHEAI